MTKKKFMLSNKVFIVLLVVIMSGLIIFNYNWTGGSEPQPTPTPTPTSTPTPTPKPTPTPTPTPTPVYNPTTYEPPDGKVYIGLEQGDMSVSGLNQFGDAIGKTPYLFGFFQWFNYYGGKYPTSMLNQARVACDAGVCGGVSMSWQPLDTDNQAEVGAGAENDELTIQQVANGQRDTYIREVAGMFRDFPYAKFIVFGCEMNGNWEGYGYSSSVFKTAYQRVVNIFRAENAKCAFVFQFNHAPGHNVNDVYNGREKIQNYYPGDSYVDWVSVSCHVFAWGTSPSVTQVMNSAGYLNLVTTTKPFFFSEMGAAPYWQTPSTPPLSERVTWLTGFLDYCRNTNRVKAFMYYNYDDTTLLGETSLRNAFKTGVASDAFIGG